MGRRTVLFGFWLFGYMLGFLAWLVRKPISDFIISFGANTDLAGGLLAGLAGSLLMLVAVIIWSAVD